MKLKAIWNIMVVLAFYLGFFYVVWLLRKVENGELITGVFAALFFGSIWYYLARAWEAWQKYKDKFQLVLGILCAIFFGHLWITTLQTIGEYYITGVPCPIARDDFVGWFGITGFWGIGIAIPIYIGIMAVMWGIVITWGHYDLTWKIKYWWRNRK